MAFVDPGHNVSLTFRNLTNQLRPLVNSPENGFLPKARVIKYQLIFNNPKQIQLLPLIKSLAAYFLLQILYKAPVNFFT